MNTEQHQQAEIAPELLIRWSIVVFQEGDQWMALALEHNCLWWADTQEEAFTGLIDALYLQAEADRGYGQVPFSLARRASEGSWGLYRRAVKSTKLQIPSPLVGEVRVLA